MTPRAKATLATATTGRSWRMLGIFVAALAVIAGHAGDGGLRAPRGGPGAPGAGGHGAHAYARRRHRLAHVAQARQRSSRGTEAVVSEGLGQYKQLTASLRRLQSARRAAQPHAPGRAAPRRGLRPGHAGTARLPERSRAGRAHREGAFRSRHAPLRRRHRGASPRSRTAIARAAQQRTWLGWLGSLTIGLLLLCLLGWRMHRIQRRSAVAEQARDAERRGEERLHALVRHSSDVVAVVDGDLAVRWLAESVRGALGYDPADARRAPG